MAEKQTAFVVVRRAWFDDALAPIIKGAPSSSDFEGHLLIGPLESLSDLHGVWLRDFTTLIQRKDGSRVTMRLMIPWQYVMALGVVDESVKLPAGFGNATVLTEATPGE